MPVFEDGELRARIREARKRAASTPGFEDYRGIGDDFTRHQRQFITLWIEEALRASDKPTASQIADQKSAIEEARATEDWLVKKGLTPAQQREVAARLDPANKARIPHHTYRVLHRHGLVSTQQRLTDLGTRIAKRLTSAKS